MDSDQTMAVQAGGSGPDVVLLHGIPGSAQVWDRVAEPLARGHRVTVPDLLGFGHSARPRTAPELWASAQAEALEATLLREGVERAVVVGHDFGGPVALTLAARRPDLVRGLVLAATNCFGDTPVPFPLSTVTWPVAGRVFERVLLSAPGLSLMLRQGTGGASRIDERGRYLGDGAQIRAIRTIFADALRNLSTRYAPVERALRDFDGPVAVVWGERDPFFGLDLARRTAATARAADGPLVLRGAGHFLPEERPDELARTIAQLVQRVGRVAASA